MGVEILEQVYWRSCDVHGNIQGLAGWVFEQPKIVEDVPNFGGLA